MVAQHQPEPSMNTEFRYYSGTKSRERNPASLYRLALPLRRRPGERASPRTLDAATVGQRGGEALGACAHRATAAPRATRRASSGTFWSTTMWFAPSGRAKANQRPSGETS